MAGSYEAVEPKYPEIEVQLSGQSDNAFSIIARTGAALRKAGVSREDQEAFSEEATAGNYEQLIQTVMRWVTVS